MGARSRTKWQNRHARRVLELVKDAQPKNPGDAPPLFEAAVLKAWHEVQERRSFLSQWRQAGGGLRDLLATGGGP